MGLLDFAAKVVLTYKADVSDAKAGLRSLSGEEKKLAAERLARDEAANKRIEGQIKGIGMLAAGVGAAIGSIALASKALDAYGKTSDEAAKKVAGIKTASDKAMDAVMVSIGQTVIAMEPLIMAITSVIKLLGDAGAAGPLAMGALALAISGNPVIAALVLGASSGTDPADIIFNAQGYIDGKMAQKKKGAQGALDAARRFDMDPTTLKGIGDKVGGAISNAIDQGVRRGLGVSEWGKLEYNGKGKPRAGKWGDVAGSPYTDWTDYGPRDIGGRPDSAAGIAAENRNYGGSFVGQERIADDKSRDMYGRAEDLSALINDDNNKKLAEMAASAKELAAINASGPTVMERLLGTHDDMAIYASLFQGLSSTIQGTFDAMVTGSEPAAQALKRLAATGVMAIAKEMLAGSIHFGAKAIGAAASYNYVQAGMYATTAAKYAAGAAAVGVIASQMGGGGGSMGGGGGTPQPSAPAYYGPTGGGSSDRAAPVIVVGSPFAYDSPRNQQKNAKRFTGLALGTNSVVYG